MESATVVFTIDLEGGAGMPNIVGSLIDLKKLNRIVLQENLA